MEACKVARLILWFRNDLRVHDNVILHIARQLIQTGKVKEALPVYCFDPRTFDNNVIDRTTMLKGFPKVGKFRAKFQMESVLELKRRLRELNSDLLITTGRPEEVLPKLALDEGASILCQEEGTYEEKLVEKNVEKALAKQNGNLEMFWGPTLYHIRDLPFHRGMQELPDVYTPFLRQIEKTTEIRSMLPALRKDEIPFPKNLPGELVDFFPKWENLPLHESVKNEGLPEKCHPNAALDFKGGEAAALKRVKYYLWDSDCAGQYFETRNGLLGGDFSTKFAPWLALGCLSPRHIYYELKKYERERVANKSTYWIYWELTCRDWFRFYALKYGTLVFKEDGVTGSNQRWKNDLGLFKKWCEGTTGIPFVDANMRELNETGFMSNRGRQNVSSFLALDLGIDWRLGADYFESKLIDHDVASNWVNWMKAAGLEGGRVNRFNVVKQAKDYDPEGTYIRTWVPELANVPAPYIFEPWKLSPSDRGQYLSGLEYPPPVRSRYTQPGGGERGGGRRGGDNGYQRNKRGGGNGRGNGKGRRVFDARRY